jgi:WD40-like Beta Propeller Repeat
MRTSIVAALTAAACLAVAGPAAADSIVYIKDDNVWVAGPDGSGQHQVTTDGEPGWRYASPSQADDGTIVAAKGTDIVRMKQNGQVLSSFDPPATTDSAGQHIDGVPLGVAISPDGSKIAYTFTQANCPPGVSCGIRYVTMYSHSDRATDPEEFGKLYRRSASWVTNDRALVFGGFGSQVNIDDFGGANDSDVHWFDDADVFGQADATDLGDGELSPQGDRLAILRGYGDAPPAAPAPACATGAEPTLRGPSWSPDGRTIAFEHKEGIETMRLPNVADGGCAGAESGRVVLPGGSQPDWGPADVNPGEKPPCTVHCDKPPPPCTAGCQPPPCPDCGDVPAATIKVGPLKPVKLAAAARKGFALKVTVPGAGRLTVGARLGGKKVGSGSTTTPGAGTATVTVRLTKKAAAALRKAKKPALSLAVTYVPVDGGPRLTRTITLKIKR